MKRLLLAAAGLATALGLAVLLRPDVGHAQVPGGPNSEPFAVPVNPPPGGAGAQPGSSILQTLQPNSQGAPGGSYLPTTPGYTKLPGAQTGPGGQAQVYIGSSDRPHYLADWLNQNLDNISINNDVAVHPGCGEWMICVNWYSGPEAPKMAHDLCLELRGPEYNLHAYVFTKGLEERKEELKRIVAYVEQMRERLAKTEMQDMPIRVPVTRYEIQCAVLVGGYKDMETARRVLDQLKELGKRKPMDPKKVQMHYELIAQQGNKPEELKGQYAPVDPLTHGMVVHNPTIQMQTAAVDKEADMRLMRLLNEDEPFSLLKCPKKYTLAVKQFSLPVEIKQQQVKSSSLFDKLNFGGSTEKEDGAAISAHNMADLLRKWKVEAYVLHTKHCSYVCVGSYDSPDDRRLKQDQERLPQANAQLDPAIQFVARPVVMEVPH
jgi:hypothetical protein